MSEKICNNSDNPLASRRTDGGKNPVRAVVLFLFRSDAYMYDTIGRHACHEVSREG